MLLKCDRINNIKNVLRGVNDMTTASLDTYFEKQKAIAHFENLEEFLNDEDIRIRSLAIKATNKLNKILKLHPAIVDVFDRVWKIIL